MPSRAPHSPSPRRTWWLRRADQAVVGGLTLAGMIALAAYWLGHGGMSGGLIEIDEAPPLTAQFEVDINQADWPELAQLPDIGETLARRIVDSRRHAGPFLDHDDLRRVPGIGPVTLERVKPYLRPMPDHAATAGR
jgi:competence protein ComEA